MRTILVRTFSTFASSALSFVSEGIGILEASDYGFSNLINYVNDQLFFDLFISQKLKILGESSYVRLGAAYWEKTIVKL